MTTEIKISEDENTIEVDGKVLKATVGLSLCHGCYFYENILLLPNCGENFPCCIPTRKDKRNVIFKELLIN